MIPEPVESDWELVYFLSRAFVNGDRYGAVAKNPNDIASVTSLAASAIALEGGRAAQAAHFAAGIRNILGTPPGAKVSARREATARLASELAESMTNRHRLEVLSFTVSHVLPRLEAAVNSAPSSDEAFAKVESKALLAAQGPAGVNDVVQYWDILGTNGCLKAERLIVADALLDLKRDIGRAGIVDDKDVSLVESAFLQELERRLGQKRKGRAGNSLESVTQVILDHFSLPSGNAPDHFQADIEVDRWLKCKNGWTLGVSCKRTLRERWKQVSSADTNAFLKHKIHGVWHLITYDRDLTEDKVRTLAAQGHKFFVPDDSSRLKEFSKNKLLAPSVLPLSTFVAEAREISS